MSTKYRENLANQARELFFHGYNSYMTYAYPEDELMPISCRGRQRGREVSRGDIDDVLGRYSLTLVDSLDTLALLGNRQQFYTAVRLVIAHVKFDADLVVSVFEVNIRMIGGLLGAHAVLVEFKKQADKNHNQDVFLLRLFFYETGLK